MYLKIIHANGSIGLRECETIHTRPHSGKLLEIAIVDRSGGRTELEFDTEDNKGLAVYAMNDEGRTISVLADFRP